MREQEGIQAFHFQDAGWQCLQAVEAQIQVGQVGQATQASGECGQGALEAGTQCCPALPTWEGRWRMWPSEPDCQVPAQPINQGRGCAQGGKDLTQHHPSRDTQRHQQMEGGRDRWPSPETHLRKNTPPGSCRVQKPVQPAWPR